MDKPTSDPDGASSLEVKFRPETSKRADQIPEVRSQLLISQQLNNDLSDFLSDASKITDSPDGKPSFYVADEEVVSAAHVDSKEIEGHHRTPDFPHITFGLAAIHHGRKDHKHRKSLKKERKKSTDGQSMCSPPLPANSSTKAARSASFQDGERSSAGPEESGPAASFYVGSDPGISPASSVDVEAQRSGKNKRKPKLRRELADYQREIGSEIHLAADLHAAADEIMLGDAAVDDITTHRFAPFKGLRHRKVTKKSSGGLSRAQPWKKTFDHSAHEMFVELDELNAGKHDDYMWLERARWIKFEEDVEEGSHRWGKPHVACLSFHSLLELRKCIEDGVVLLDLEASDLPTIATAVVDHCIFSDLLDPAQRDKILGALLLKHSHVGDTSFKNTLSYLDLHAKDSAHHLVGESHALIKKSNRSASHSDFYDIKSSRKHSSKEKMNSALRNSFQDEIERLKEDKRILDERTSPNAQMLPSAGDSLSEKSVKSSGKHVRIDLSQCDEEEHKDTGLTPRMKRNESSGIFKRIPKGAEATSVLVGDLDYLDKPLMAFIRLSQGQLLSNLTEVPVPVRFMFLVLGPSSAKLDYYEIGRSISTLMADPDFSHMAYQAGGRKDLLDAINQFLDDSIVLPPGNLDKETLLPVLDMAHDRLEKKNKKRKEALQVTADKPGDDPLERTGRPFGGVVRDVKRRYALYLSDIKDGLNMQCFATFFFIYFACLSPAITFGGLMGESTDKYIGVSEMLIMVCVSGILMALLSGQPLVIVGATGPLLVFEENFYQICQSIGVEYLPFRFWVGIWITVIALLVVMFEGVFVIKYITRFLQEIFSALISLIFIYEVFRKLYYIFRDHPLVAYYPPPQTMSPDRMNDSYLYDEVFTMTVLDGSVNANLSPVTNVTYVPYDPTKKQPNTALLAVILTFGTFLIAYALKIFRNGKFLGRQVRRAIGDFGIPIAIVVMVLIDFLIKDTYTDKLDVPDGFSPTAPHKRGWVVNPLGETRPLPVWAYFAAVIPALLVSILIFMETLITSLIVNKPEKKLKKGSGYHLDLLLVGLFATLSGIFGLPLLCVATVRSVTHVSALMVYSRTHAPGEKPKLIEVKEQRLTGLMVHIMIGISVLLGPVLRQVPLAVLFGVFLYMGVASISGIQLFERIELLFMPVKHHPPVSYVRKVRTLKMHLYTLIQILCLGVLWAIKSTQAALSFPFFLILLIPVRLKILALIFNEQELKYLDGDEDAVLEEDEPDFCVQALMPM